MIRKVVDVQAKTEYVPILECGHKRRPITERQNVRREYDCYYCDAVEETKKRKREKDTFYKT